MSKGNKNSKANNKTKEISAFFTAQRVVYGGITWGVAALLFFLLFGIGEDRPLWYTIGTYIFEQGAFFAAALLCLKNWTSPQIASGRNVWLGIGLGNFCFGFGGFLFGFWELYWGLDPAVSPGDLFYFLFYILVSWGMLWAVIPRKISLERWQWLTIAGIASLGIAIAALLTVTDPAEATTLQQFAQATPTITSTTSPTSPTPTLTPTTSPASPASPTSTITPTATTPPTPRVNPATPAIPTPTATSAATPATTPAISPTVISPSPNPIPSSTATPRPAATPMGTPTTTPSPLTPSPIEAEAEPESAETIAYGGAPPQFILDMEKQLEPFSQIVALAYVVGDVFLLIIATMLLMTFWGGRFAQSWRMVAAASFCMYIADMWFKYASERIPDYLSGSVLEVFWVFSGVLFGIGAALEYDNSMRTRRGGRKRA